MIRGWAPNGRTLPHPVTPDGGGSQRLSDRADRDGAALQNHPARARPRWARAAANRRRPSVHVAVEPLQHRLWATLELQVAVPTGRRTVDPVQRLIRHGDVVE